MTATSLSGMRICTSFINDNKILINIGSSVLCQIKVCAMIWHQAVYFAKFALGSPLIALVLWLVGFVMNKAESDFGLLA